MTSNHRRARLCRRRQGMQAEDLGHWRRARAPATPQAKHQRTNRGQRMAVDGSQVDSPARAAAGAVHVKPWRSGDQRRPDHWRHSMSRPATSCSFQRSMTAFASAPRSQVPPVPTPTPDRGPPFLQARRLRGRASIDPRFTNVRAPTFRAHHARAERGHRHVTREAVDVHNHFVPTLVTLHGERPRAVAVHVAERHRLNRIVETPAGHGHGRKTTAPSDAAEHDLKHEEKTLGYCRNGSAKSCAAVPTCSMLDGPEGLPKGGELKVSMVG